MPSLSTKQRVENIRKQIKRLGRFHQTKPKKAARKIVVPARRFPRIRLEIFSKNKVLPAIYYSLSLSFNGCFMMIKGVLSSAILLIGMMVWAGEKQGGLDREVFYSAMASKNAADVDAE